MSNIVDIYLVGGQSNADGRQSSPVNPLAEPDGTLTGLQVYNHQTGGFSNWKMGTNSGAFTVTSAEWCPGGYALKLYRDFIGASTLFCVKTTRGSVSMSPNANSVGSFSINTTAVTGESIMFDQLRSRIDAARNIFARQGKAVRFKGMLWHQSEADAGTPFNALYQLEMEAFIAATRHLTWNDSLPFIMGTIPHASASYDSIIESAQYAIAAGDPNVYLIDLSAQPIFDSYHLNNIGKAYFGSAACDILKSFT